MSKNEGPHGPQGTLVWCMRVRLCVCVCVCQLHSVMLLTTGGMPLYVKEFQNEGSLNHQMLGNLITAMIRFCELKTGFPVSFYERRNVTIMPNPGENCRLTPLLDRAHSSIEKLVKAVNKKRYFNL